MKERKNTSVKYEPANPEPHASERGSISRNKLHIVFANCQASGASNMGS
jgi:hypothetical protein